MVAGCTLALGVCAAQRNEFIEDKVIRKSPPGVTGEAKAEWEAGEPAWRLLHAVTLHEIYRARCRTHAAYHASPQTSPKATSTKHVVRRIDQVYR